MGLPNVVVEFRNKAATAVTRSERGVVCVVLTDATKTTTLHEYKTASDVPASDWTAENAGLLKDALEAGASKLYAVRLGANEDIDDVKATLDALKFNWICHLNTTQTDIVSYVAARNASGSSLRVKAIVSGAAAPDDMHVVNLKNTKVTKTDGTELTANKYLPHLAGVLAGLGMDRSVTYYELSDLQSVDDVEKPGEAVDGGYLVLINDYGTVKIARGVNSATTAENDDFKKIAIVEAMDMIREDIMETFKNYYLGKYKNSLDNQSLFVAAVNTYFRTLTGEGVLNPDYDNLAEIDTTAQRSAIVASGKTEALDWDDQTVKKSPFKSNVYLKANVQILDAIEDLTFSIYMN
mgnify:CR=1 FL=1